MKLKDEVGMAGSKSTQTRYIAIGIITLISLHVHPYACFFFYYHALVDGDPCHWCYILSLNLLCMSVNILHVTDDCMQLLSQAQNT